MKYAVAVGKNGEVYSNEIRTNFYITEKMKKEIGGIQSYQEFLEKYGNNVRYKRWNIFLENIQNKLIDENYINQDPIQYLLYLYSIHGEGYSLKRIFEEFVEYSINKNRDTFVSFFKKSLKWDTRGKEECTNLTLKTITHKRNIRATNEKEMKEKVKEEIIKILENGKNKTNNLFDYEEYNKCQNKIEKIKFILDYLGIIPKNKFEEKLKYLKSEFGLTVTLEAVQKIIDNTDDNIPKINFHISRLIEICSN